MDFSICVNTVGFPKYSHIWRKAVAAVCTYNSYETLIASFKFGRQSKNCQTAKLKSLPNKLQNLSGGMVYHRSPDNFFGIVNQTASCLIYQIIL